MDLVSDEVEGRILLLEAGVDNWWLMTSGSSLTDKRSEPVSVSDDGRFLDGSADVVVGEAEFVSQRLDEVRRGLDVIVDDGVSCWRGHSLSSGDRDEIELVGVLVGDVRVDDSAWNWVLEASWLASEHSHVDSLAHVDVHELA